MDQLSVVGSFELLSKLSDIEPSFFYVMVGLSRVYLINFMGSRPTISIIMQITTIGFISK